MKTKRQEKTQFELEMAVKLIKTRFYFRDRENHDFYEIVDRWRMLKTACFSKKQVSKEFVLGYLATMRKNNAVTRYDKEALAAWLEKNG